MARGVDGSLFFEAAETRDTRFIEERPSRYKGILFTVSPLVSQEKSVTGLRSWETFLWLERLATEQEVNRLERMRELSTAVNLSFSFRTPSISCLSAAIPRTTINRRNEDWMLIEIDWCRRRIQELTDG